MFYNAIFSYSSFFCIVTLSKVITMWQTNKLFSSAKIKFIIVTKNSETPFPWLKDAVYIRMYFKISKTTWN